MNEQEQFLSDLDIKDENTVLEQPIEPAEEPVKEETEEEAEYRAKNRRERRLVAENQRLREEAIAYAARLETIKESQTLRSESEMPEYAKRLEKIFGNTTPEAKEATEILLEAFKGLEETAANKALSQFENERGNEAKAVREEEQNLDEILDSVEDEHGIDMSNEADRKGFLNLLERVSPKDREGNIIEFADANSTAELYLSLKEKQNSRNKELSSRSMTRSGASQPSKLEVDAREKFLRDAGII